MSSKIDAGMGSAMGPKLGYDAPMTGSNIPMSSDTHCNTPVDSARDEIIHIFPILLLCMPPKLKGREKQTRDEFSHHFSEWTGLKPLETIGIHPPIARYDTRKWLMKHPGLSDWIKFYLTILNDLKCDCALKGTKKLAQYPNLWKVLVILEQSLWLILWTNLTTLQKESCLWMHELFVLFCEDATGFIGIISVCSLLMCVEGEY